MNVSILKSNNELRIAICEDNPEHLSINHEFLLRNAGRMEPLFYLYTSGSSLLEDVEAGKKFDVLFCDIEMPDINGIEIGNAMRRYNENLILVYLTAYPQYAIQAYETRAFRYLLKPFTDETARDIMAAVAKESSRYRKLVFKDWETVHFVEIADILYLEAKEKYTYAYTKDEEFSGKTSLNEYALVLEAAGFFRIHRKYLVNCFYVRELRSTSLFLSNGVELPVARSQRSSFKKLFFDAMERGIF